MTELCIKIKISFADLIKSVNVEQLTGYKDSDLACLAQVGLVTWSSNDIIGHLELKKTIKTAYLTRQASDVWESQWNVIKANTRKTVKFIQIYTPTGQRLSGKPRHQKLMRHWLFNDISPYGKFDHQWLIQHGIPVEHFNQTLSK